MSFRRPRVKASANLVLKRPNKSEKKPENTVSIPKDEVPESPRKSQKDTQPPESVVLLKTHIKSEPIKKERSPSPQNFPEEGESGNNWEHEEVFKSPDPIPVPQKIDVLPEVEREVPIGSPTPFFGLSRRNSTHESDDESRRQRGSVPPDSPSIASPMTPQMPKMLPGPLGQRIRTESTCSTMSDASQMRDGQKRRNQKADETSKTNELRKEISHRMASGKYPDKSRLTMFDMIYYNPSSNPMKSPAKKDKPKTTPDRRLSVSSVVSISSTKSDRIPSDSLEKSPPTVPEIRIKEEPAMPVPQLKLGPNGEMILDEKSLVIETTGDREARETLANASIVYDDEYSSNNGFYKRQARTKDWSDNETIIFYKCLHTVGTDFSLMCTLFTNRSRRDLKLKFKKEERLNRALVDKALMYPKSFDLDELRKELEKSAQENAAAAKDEKKQAVAEMKKERKNQRKEKFSSKKRPLRNASRMQRQLSDGDFAYKFEEILSRPRKKKRNESKSESSQKESSLPEQPAASQNAQSLEENKEQVEKEQMREDQMEEDYGQGQIEMVQIGEDPVQEEQIQEEIPGQEATEVYQEIEEIVEETVLSSEEQYFEEDIMDYDHEEEILASPEPENDLPNIDLSNLVIVQEADEGTVRYKIHLRLSEGVSEKPLDLPQDIINCIVAAHLGQKI
uniref:Transcription factor TFIIIB component B'' Myb domain-containing protein n=1 Tax=Phlebotomus papatasi TaxID=29031 RepID=A0A1B0D8B3_PHLPP